MSRINWWFFAGTYSIGAAGGLALGYANVQSPTDVAISAGVLVVAWIISTIQWARQGRSSPGPGGDT